MAKMVQCRPVLSISLFVFLAVGGCASENGNSQKRLYQKGVLQELVSSELLEAGRLEVVWQNKLPIKKGESLERLFILGDRIYALSDSNYIISLSKENGNVIFSRSIVSAGLPVLRLGLYEKELFSIAGNKLVEINTEFGTELRSKRLGFGVTCPAARNRLNFYVAGADRRLRTLRAEDKVKLFEVSAENESIITSIVANEKFVVFGTDKGNVISIAADRPKKLWQFNAADGIVGPIIRDANSLFFASKDTNVYNIDILRGKLAWRYPYKTAAALDKAPRVTEEVVYQYVQGKGLAAIDRENGELLWHLAEGIDLLMEADRKAYVITNIGTMVVMDNKKARRLYSVNFAGVSKYAANTMDSKVYIADKSGRIACLKPIE